MATINLAVSPVWPATGLAISLLFLGGTRYWPAIFTGAFFANFAVGNPLLSVLSISIGNTLEALSGAYVLNTFLKRRNLIYPHSRTLAIVLASVSGSVISATIGTLSLTLNGISPVESFGILWLTWLTGDTLGGLIIIPLFLSFFKNKFYEIEATSLNLKHAVPIFICGLILCYFLFIRPDGAPFLFFVFPLLLWSANALREKGISTATFIISTVGILSVALGFGVFTHGSTNANLLNLQLFLGAVGICALMMSDLRNVSNQKQPVTILLVSWLLAGIFFFGFYQRTSSESDKRFNDIINGVEPYLEARMNLYFSALQSGNALFAASDDVTSDEWKSFLQIDRQRETLPGLSGMGVIFRVPKNHINQREEKIFAVNQGDAYVITYFEVLEGHNHKLHLGMDASESRRQAADLARDTGRPSLTGRILLDDVSNHSDSIIALSPFYAKGKIPNTIEERRKNCIGWIFALIHIKEFIESVFSVSNFPEIGYAVYENKKNSLVPISHSPDYFTLPEAGEVERVMHLRNQEFIFRFKKSTAFFSSHDNLASWAGAVASLISLLIGTFIISIQTVKSRALALADLRTRDLKASEELWKFALQGSGNGVWDLNLKSNTVKLASDFKKALGYESYELNSPDLGWEWMLYPEDLHLALEKIRLHLEGKGIFSGEYRLQCKNGEYKWFQARGSLVSHDSDGNPERMVGTISDISARKAAETALQEQREKLLAAAKMSSLGEMAGGIAHEINNPLAIIQGKASQLKRRLKEISPEDKNIQDLNEGLFVIETTTKRISAIIRGLSAFSRNAENDSLDRILVPVLIQDTLELSKERFRFHSISLKYDLRACENTFVNGRAAQLLQVLVNLLNNAYDAVEFLPEKWVKIDTEATEKLCRIKITDSGGGIPDELTDKIMMPFFSTKSVGKGTGLGLSISKGIIEEHKGRLYYDKSSRNTCFVIELPVA
jgi:PAS domain S-box-containing protein